MAQAAPLPLAAALPRPHLQEQAQLGCVRGGGGAASPRAPPASPGCVGADGADEAAWAAATQRLAEPLREGKRVGACVCLRVGFFGTPQAPPPPRAPRA